MQIYLAGILGKHRFVQTFYTYQIVPICYSEKNLQLYPPLPLYRLVLEYWHCISFCVFRCDYVDSVPTVERFFCL